MRRSLAHGVALAVLVAGLGAAQGPSNSEATPEGSTFSRNAEIRNQSSKMRARKINFRKINKLGLFNRAPSGAL